jgi:acetaldehyde dehydrogenase/alcohol dehydrogenase
MKTFFSRENMLWLRVPPKIYFKPGCLEVGLREYKNRKRAFLVTDKSLYDMGFHHKVTNILDQMGQEHFTFYRVHPDPDLKNVKDILNEMNQYQPDLIIAFGGGSPMDAAKIAWLLYEQPDTDFESLASTFMV